MKKFCTPVLATGLLAGLLPAQGNQRDLAAGFGAQSLVIDLDGATGQGGSLGVTHLNGEIFTSTRISPAVGGLHFVSVFDGSGNKLRSWFQPGFAQASAWGFRDGTTDGCNLLFGFDFGIEITDINGNLLDGLSGPNICTGNGPATVPGGLISGNVLDPNQAGMTRALAFDRYGDGGNGSFWTGNFGSSIFEIGLSGDVLHSYTNAGQVSYGFGLDPVSRPTPTSPATRMWINSGPAATGSLELAAYDLTTGTLTGQTMRAIQGIQGGLDIVPGTLGRGPNASGYDILHLQQGAPDEARIRRLHLDVAGQGIPPSPVTRLGTEEPDLLIGIDDELHFPRSDAGMLVYPQAIPNCTLPAAPNVLNVYSDIGRNPGDGAGLGGLNGTAAVIFANVGPDAALGLDAVSNLLGIRELAHLQPLLTSPSASVAVQSRGVIMGNDPLNPGTGDWRLAFPSGVYVQPIGGCLRFQTVYIDPDVAYLPIALTNQARFCRGPVPVAVCGTFAEARGANSFNADTSSGFFRITNGETDPAKSIVTLRLELRDLLPNSANAQALIDNFFRFDTDENNMADVFEGGNSLASGCRGTFRNGSDVATGLIFSGTVQQNATPCDDAAMQGWIGGPATPFPGSDGDWLELEFNFSPGTFMNGETFEFDCDTDGGIGVSGADMAGLFVWVRFNDGSISETELTVAPVLPDRAIGQL
ncbi:MAG: hypothetical protein ACYTG5_07220 [Planctomycetota bacterium]|jgi:hypothetical protein